MSDLRDIFEGLHVFPLKGYNASENQKRDYNEGKKPKYGYLWQTEPGLTREQADAWEATAGWLGARVPDGYIVCDIDEKERGERIAAAFNSQAIIIQTPRGYQLVFREGRPSTGTWKLTLGGFISDYRNARKNYLVLPRPNTEGRSVVGIPESIAPMPLCFVPVRGVRKDKDDNILPEDLDLLLPAIVTAPNDAYIAHLGRMRGWNARHRLGLSDAELTEVLVQCDLIFSPRPNEKAVHRLCRSAFQSSSFIEPEPKAEQKKPGLLVLDVNDFLQHPVPQRDLILSPWLHSQGIAELYGPRGIGKTFIGLSIAVAMATGTTMWSWRQGAKVMSWAAPKPRRVLYLDGEMPAQALQDRLKTALSHALGQTDSVPDLRVITPDVQGIEGPGIPDLSTESGQAELEPALEGIEVLILDNLSCLCRSGRENESESWVTVQSWLLRLRARGLTVLFLHHAGKGGNQRGTSKREDILDAVVALRKPADYKPDEGCRAEVHFEKSRSVYGDAVRPIEVTLSSGVWRVRGLEDSLKQRVAEMLSDGVPVRDIAEAIDRDRTTVYRLRKELEKCHV